MNKIIFLNIFFNIFFLLAGDECRVVMQKDGVDYYEIDRTKVVFAQQYILEGKIQECRIGAGGMRFVFYGKVNFKMVGLTHGDGFCKNNSFQLDVNFLPVHIECWKDESINEWGEGLTSFKNETDKLMEMEKKCLQKKIAIKTPAMIFSDSGKLIAIEGGRLFVK